MGHLTQIARRSTATLAALLLSLAAQGSEESVGAHRRADIREAQAALAREAETHGGWQGWHAALKPWRARWAERLETAPDAGKGVIAGSDGFFFLRTWESYVLEPDYIHAPESTQQSAALRTLINLNTQLLARGIHFIVVPVPSRSEIYPEQFLPPPVPPVPMAPQRKQFIHALLENNVESIDLLPALIAAKSEATMSLKNDTHWTSQGAAVAARVISARLSRYDWEHIYGRPPSSMRTNNVGYSRSWSIYERLSPENQARHPSGPVVVSQVRLPDGTPYAPDPTVPLLVTGDSFLFFYAPVQADVSAHIGANLGYPVATKPMGGGQAARVARGFARMSAEKIAQYRVVVFIFVAPYLRYDNWKPAPLPRIGKELGN
ncbi:MAG: hypothetical protein L3K26_13355 [Candidatus Hydrogenedentes bacterium]|nr:hypothetical protein [Candidatus Hydrogenedentota bacterium]